MKGSVMELTIGCTTRPYAGLSYEEAFERIAAAGYTDVAVFASQKVVPVRSDSSEPKDVDRDIAFTQGYVKGILSAL